MLANLTFFLYYISMSLFAYLSIYGNRKLKRRLVMGKETLVVGSKVKDFIKEADLRSDGDLVDALSGRVEEILKNAMARCKENGRSTVRPCDL